MAHKKGGPFTLNPLTKRCSAMYNLRPLARSTLEQSTFDLLRCLAKIAFDLIHSSLDTRTQQMTLDAVKEEISTDLLAYHERDPSVRHKPISCLVSVYSTYFAIFSYRLSHQLIRHAGDDEGTTREAMHLSFAARSNTGIEIHPEALIGKRFVIDHGWGTVIGQTVEIGDDCYLLNNITLGGRDVADAHDGKRHPTIGDRVQICARAKVFGPIIVGDDCFIGPDVTLTEDLARGTTLLHGRGPVVTGTFREAERTPALAGLS
ncbi:serine acetyltransferase [Cereibacter changlensis]|uniref:Serine acetyltransferase n=2 Tax=Cereibacter changlensis TaxID=402884 RepID=A0A4U0YZS1_9RHOB|nr:serine acetyltransferase [Cereibacter changlensis]